MTNKLATNKVCAVVGGRFDPFHNAHQKLIKNATQLLPCQKILVIPNGAPQHKVVSIDWQDSVQMCKLGTQDMNNVEVLTIESPEKKRFSIDTANELKEKFNTQIWVVGGDTFAMIDTWHRWQEMLTLVNWAVMPRDDFAWMPDKSSISSTIKKALVKDVNQLATGQGKVWVWDKTLGKISSSNLKELISTKNENWKKQVPVTVANYVETHNLYVNANV